MTNLEIVTKKIQEAVPEIMELKFGCEVENKKSKKRWVIARKEEDRVVYVPNDNDFNYDWIEHYDNDLFKILGRKINLEDILMALDNSLGWYETTRLIDHWQPNKTLDQQSEETINFLKEILDK